MVRFMTRYQWIDFLLSRWSFSPLMRITLIGSFPPDTLKILLHLLDSTRNTEYIYTRIFEYKYTQYFAY